MSASSFIVLRCQPGAERQREQVIRYADELPLGVGTSDREDQEHEGDRQQDDGAQRCAGARAADAR